MTPYVTVLMSVYNGENYLQEAIDSILNQTFRDFEFLIVDDGSTDRTAAILASFAIKDPRIKVVTNESNMGISRSLNKGLTLARGKYIARMDADDISLAERLEKQVQFMDNNPEIGVCGSWYKEIGSGKHLKIVMLPEKHDDLFAAMLFRNKMAHPSVIIRKKTILNLGQFYNEELVRSQDGEYWARLAILGVKFANVGEVLLNYRIHRTQATKTQKSESDKVLIMPLQKLGFNNAENRLDVHAILRKGIPSDKDTIEKIVTWINKILLANKTKKIFSEPALLREIAKHWFKLCYRSSNNGLCIWKMYHRHPLSKSITLSPEQKIKFLIKCLLGINSRHDFKRKLFFKQ